MKITLNKKKFAASVCAMAVSMGVFAPVAQAAGYDSLSSSLLGSSLPNFGTPNIPLPNIPNIPNPTPTHK